MENKVILLVEDNPRDEALTIRALAKCNIRNNVVVVRDGVEALDYLFARADFAHRDITEVPQVILLDLKLPKLDGFEVLAEIRSNEYTRRQPVVIFTSSDEEEDRIKGYDLGVNSFVRKPVDFDQFVEATRQIGLYWILINLCAPPVVKEIDG